MRKQPSQTKAETKKLLKKINQILDDDKAVDAITIDLKDKTPMADFLVIVSGTSHRHVSSLADHLISKLKDAGYGRPHVEGKEQGDWVLVDTGDVIVHIFRPEVRSFYNLEKMWTIDIDEALS